MPNSRLISNEGRFLFFLMVFILVGSSSQAQTAPNEVSSGVGLKMEKGTLREVFDLYARERSLNLIIDPTIPKDKIVDLFIQDLPIDEMFELVIAANNLGVKKYGNNALLVYPMEKSQVYKGEPEIRKFSLDDTSVDVVQFKEILNSQFSDCRFYIDKNNLNSIVGMGSRDSLDRVTDLFKVFTSSLQKVDRLFVPLKNIDSATAIASLKNLDKNVTILDSPGKNGVIIVGQKTAETAQLLRRIDEEPGQETKVYDLHYQDLSKLAPLIKSIDKKANILSLPDDNKLIVQAKGQTLQFIDQAVKALDKPKRQVLFKFQLVEIDLETMKKLGLQISQQAYTVSEIKGLIDSQIYSFLVNLAKDSKHGRILASPQLKVYEGKTAKITIADRIPLEVAATSQTDSGSLLKFNTQLQWVEAGIKFNVANVRVHDETKTSLDLRSEVSSVVGYTAKGYPLLRTREAETTLLIKDGETVILAGLINREDRVTTSKVPYLSNLPLLGRLFVTNDRRKINSEILLFITPHIESEEADEIANSPARAVSPPHPLPKPGKINQTLLEKLREKVRQETPKAATEATESTENTPVRKKKNGG